MTGSRQPTQGRAPPGLGGQPIRFSSVSKHFETPGTGRVAAINTITLDVPARQFLAIVGPSGCGKSTLLRLADGLIAPDQGQVTIGGVQPVPGPRIGLMFQNFRLIPWRNVSGNIAFALEGQGLSRAEISERVYAQLDQVGLLRWREHYPSQLSGGMRQRVALARALVGQPDVLLMDEPFASLDAQTRELMQEDLLSLWERHRPTVLFVTHSVDEALLLADRVIIMGAGAILEDIAVGLPRPRGREATRQTAEFGALRAHLWTRIRDLVLADPNSAFYGRGAR
jgi:NitT/TauT family transport system ATP-binding protein